MKEVWIAVIGGVFSVLTAIAGSQTFAPGLLRLDIFFPTKEPEILDDFVFVNFRDYRERATEQPFEKYENPHTNKLEDVFDKATYVEHVWLRRTNAPYTIRLGSTGSAPEIRAIDPPIKEQHIEEVDGEPCPMGYESERGP